MSVHRYLFNGKLFIKGAADADAANEIYNDALDAMFKVVRENGCECSVEVVDCEEIQKDQD